MSQVSYKDAGVDIDVADGFVSAIGPLCRATHGPQVLQRRSGFGSLFRADFGGMRDPLLVSSTDGVGTKLKLAFATGIHHTVGIDLVAMNVNDILAMGAKPLFFLDYFASGRLDPSVAVSVVQGIAEGCKQAECALIGGETAELPGFYGKGEYELAGFVVGVVDAPSLIDGTAITVGDQLIGLPSSGFHSNGYSLVRLLVERRQIDLAAAFDDSDSWAEALLRPTRIYFREMQALRERVTLKGVAHITGGGLTENIPRIPPDGCAAHLDMARWTVPAVIRALADGQVSAEEQLRTFNMGLGLVLAVETSDVATVLALVPDAVHVGEIIAGPRNVSIDGWR